MQEHDLRKLIAKELLQMNKDKIIDAVKFLLESACSRGTTQGIVVYEKVLEMLEGATGDEELVDVLGKLNRSLAGMEAHGDFMDAEFAQVQILRAIEDKFL